jgi:hypothetical protein
MTDPRPEAKPKRSKGKTAGIVIGVVIGVAVAVYIVVALGSATINIVNQPPSTITVSGTVQTEGFSTRPVSVTFRDQSTGEQQSAGVNGGSYEIVLPNGNHNWRVAVGWQGAVGATGECFGGGLSYSDTYDQFQTLDLSC